MEKVSTWKEVFTAKEMKHLAMNGKSGNDEWISLVQHLAEYIRQLCIVGKKNERQWE